LIRTEKLHPRIFSERKAKNVVLPLLTKSNAESFDFDGTSMYRTSATGIPCPEGGAFRHSRGTLST